VTAGASAPEVLVKEVIACLERHGIQSIQNLDGVEENVGFPLPKGLAQ
jgi:4-hydroxy-3-methylbut-2-enyl diphosphate reductase